MRIIKAIGIIILVDILLYLITAFVIWNYNPEFWPIKVRSFTIVMGSLIGLTVAVYDYVKSKMQ